MIGGAKGHHEPSIKPLRPFGEPINDEELFQWRPDLRPESRHEPLPNKWPGEGIFKEYDQGNQSKMSVLPPETIPTVLPNIRPAQLTQLPGFGSYPQTGIQYTTAIPWNEAADKAAVFITVATVGAWLIKNARDINTPHPITKAVQIGMSAAGLMLTGMAAIGTIAQDAIAEGKSGLKYVTEDEYRCWASFACHVLGL